MREESADFGPAHLQRMTLVVEQDEAANPLHVLLFGAERQMSQATVIPDLIEQLRLLGTRWRGRVWLTHLSFSLKSFFPRPGLSPRSRDVADKRPRTALCLIVYRRIFISSSTVRQENIHRFFHVQAIRRRAYNSSQPDLKRSRILPQSGPKRKQPAFMANGGDRQS